MKSTRTTIALLLTAVFAITGCRITTEQSTEQPGAYKTIVFNACEIATRTTFGPGQDGVYPTLWTASDQAVKLALNYTEAAEAAVTPNEGGRTASFSADIDASVTQTPYTFFAVSPASAARALSPSRQAWSVSIPAVQTPLEGSVDEAAQILAAASAASDVLPDAIDLHFNHLTAYGRMTLNNLNLNGATVERIELTASTPIVGDWYWECTEGHTITDNGASSTITLLTGVTEDVWFACAPVDMSGQKLTVTVCTDKGPFAKEITFPEGRTFKAGRIAVFSVDMSGAGQEEGDEEFRLLTDASVLKPGDQIIIADKDATVALGGSSGGTKPYRIAEAVTIDYGVVTNPGKAEILTLEAGSTSNTWALKASDGYLCTLSSGNNISAEASVSANSSWTITVTSSGAATVKATAGGSTFIRYNNMTPRFSAYGSNSSLKDPVAIYLKSSAEAAGPVEEDPLTEHSEYGCYISDKTRVYTAGADQYSRQYSDDGVLTFTILNPADKEQLEITGYSKFIVKGDNVTITVNWRQGFNTLFNNSSYKLKVVKEEGPKVWLGKGNGEGFIIKK